MLYVNMEHFIVIGTNPCETQHDIDVVDKTKKHEENSGNMVEAEHLDYFSGGWPM